MPFLLSVAVCALPLGLAACGTTPPSAATEGPTTGAVRADGSPADTQIWPLTGLAVAQGRTSSLPHPVLVAKIDNSSKAAPQQGLGSADLVVEELVEGGATRLAAFYQSRIPGAVGPIRSMRASDIGIASPADAEIVTSGAAPVTIGRVEKAGIDYVVEGSTGFFRDESRPAPYNLFATLDDVAASARTPRTRPDDYLPWGTGDVGTPGDPATTVRAVFSGRRTTSWTFEAGRYVDQNSLAKQGEEFRADSILVLRVPIRDAGYRDPAGNPVPETVLRGTGDATLFHDGEAIEATWRKDELESAIWLGNESGDLLVPAGRVWVALVPTTTGDVAYE